mgnify:CR=1 FL=1
MTQNLILAFIALGLLWEFYALASPEALISPTMMEMSQKSPLTTYALSVLVGHFFVQPPTQYTLAGQINEYAEVGIVIGLGAALQTAVVLYPGLIPLPWHVNLALILFAICLGAFGWTIGI